MRERWGEGDELAVLSHLPCGASGNTTVAKRQGRPRDTTNPTEYIERWRLEGAFFGNRGMQN